MNKLKFSAVWLILAGTIAWSTVLLYSFLSNPSADELLSISWLFINQLGPLSLIGIGLGLPVATLTLIFGWVHLILIMKGLIPPHLSSKGFVEALYELVAHGSASLK
ncbi:MAG: hypothetical protein U1E78_00930 [Gammaproteobacteria bacterium]